jgi:HD-GYP domain-containing protein (c-di-GMP phosphodiesterase class II)
MDEKRIKVSIELLYDGIVTPHDIHDADGKLLLIRQGQTLRMSQIEAIRRFNKDRDIISVSVETYKLLMKHAPPEKRTPQQVSTYQARIEKATGYTEIKDETFSIINEISESKTAPPEKYNALSQELSDTIEKVEPNVIVGLINALAPVDEYLQRHCMNVSLLNGLIGKWLSLPKETVDMLILVGLVHDCGKVSIPAQILDAPRKLTNAEFEVIKMHTVAGYEMLSGFPDVVRMGVRGHHEKYAARGYPDLLTGDAIPLAAQITAVSDIYDAMVSQRAYKPPKNPFGILAWVKKLSGTDLAEPIVTTFTENLPKEMLNKPVMLSNGEVGIIHALDQDDFEYPYIRIGTKVFKSSAGLYCTQMQLEEKH